MTNPQAPSAITNDKPSASDPVMSQKIGVIESKLKNGKITTSEYNKMLIDILDRTIDSEPSATAERMYLSMRNSSNSAKEGSDGEV